MRTNIFEEHCSVQLFFRKIIHHMCFQIQCYVYNYCEESLQFFLYHINPHMLHRNVWYRCGLLNLLSSILVCGRHILDRSSVKKRMKIPKFWFRLYTFLEQDALLSYNVREPCKISIRFTVLLLVTCSKLHIVLTFTFILVCFSMFLTLKCSAHQQFVLLVLPHWSESPSLSPNNHLTISSSVTCSLYAIVLDEQTTRPCTITSVNKSPTCLLMTQTPPLAMDLLRVYK